MKLLTTSSLGALAAVALMSGAMAETSLTIATVNNGDMIRMQKADG
jgi:sorbitol/mannitol transport system substrate-binding protein